MKRLLATIVAALTWACDSPTTPRQSPSPSPPVQQTRLNVSGLVTDDNGAPIAGASVGLSYALGALETLRTSTDAAGRYEFDFAEALLPPTFISAHAAVVEGSSFLSLEWAARTTVVKNIRLRRPAHVYAGQSMVISFEQDSSMCVWEFRASDGMSCEYFRVTLERPGVVTVEARPIDGGTIEPLVGWENPGPSSTFSQRLETAGRLWMNVAIPRGFTPRYEIRTWFAP